MPTYRDDLHLGHKVPMVETDDITNKSVTGDKIADRVINWWHIVMKAIRNEHINDRAVDSRTLADNAVETRHIKDKAVTPEKLSDRIVAEVIQPLLDSLRKNDKDLQNQIDSLVIGGVAVSNEFGDNPHISVSQKALTMAFSRVWTKIEDITGESINDISMVVSPSYFIGEDGCSVHITANTVDTAGIFEHIAFYINGTLLTEADNVDYFEYDTAIDETSVVKCVAKIMGVEYTQQKIVTHYNSFWLGAGSAYTDIMKVVNLIPITNGMRGAYDVVVGQGEHIIVVVGESLADGFIRADLNSVEIPFSKSTVEVDGKNYVVFTSKNAYNAGKYNIDING